jgi:hypothetical protein
MNIDMQSARGASAISPEGIDIQTAREASAITPEGNDIQPVPWATEFKPQSRVGTQPARGASASTRSTSEKPTTFMGTTDVPGRTWESSIDDLLRIRKLENDWDGEGSEAPNKALVDNAIALAQFLKGRDYPPPDKVIASVNGTVYFEWYTSFGYREMEVTSPLEAESRWVPKGANKAETVFFVRRQ